MYVDCRKNFNQNDSSLSCDRNLECVTTAGGSKWCSGPKLKECYVFDERFSQTFEEVARVILQGRQGNIDFCVRVAILSLWV